MSNRRTPLHDWHVARGARMVPFAGWDMPVQYAGIVAEHRAVRTATGIFDISHMGRLDFPGADAPAFLEGLFTNAVGTMTDGQVRYGFLCRDDGGTLDDVLVYRGARTWAMVVNGGCREKAVAWLEAHRVGRDAAVRDRTSATAMVAVQGPQSLELCEGLFDFDPAGLKYYSFRESHFRGRPCAVSRTGYTGEVGLEIVVPGEMALPLWEELIARGAVPCGLGARDTLRLEAGMPLYGHELSEAIDPIRAGLGWAVKLDGSKGDFVGRAALEAAAAAAAHRPSRIGLVLEGTRAAREGCPILNGEGRPVGTVTSGSFAPTLGRPIAMGYVEPPYTIPNGRLVVDVRGAPAPAAVVALPFYSRPK